MIGHAIYSSKSISIMCMNWQATWRILEVVVIKWNNERLSDWHCSDFGCLATPSRIIRSV